MLLFRMKRNINVKIPNAPNKPKIDMPDDVHNEDYIVYLGDDVPVVIKPSEIKPKSNKKALSSESIDGKYDACSFMTMP